MDELTHSKIEKDAKEQVEVAKEADRAAFRHQEACRKDHDTAKKELDSASRAYEAARQQQTITETWVWPIRMKSEEQQVEDAKEASEAALRHQEARRKHDTAKKELDSASRAYVAARRHRTNTETWVYSFRMKLEEQLKAVPKASKIVWPEKFQSVTSNAADMADKASEDADDSLKQEFIGCIQSLNVMKAYSRSSRLNEPAEFEQIFNALATNLPRVIDKYIQSSNGSTELKDEMKTFKEDWEILCVGYAKFRGWNVGRVLSHSIGTESLQFQIC